MCHFPILADPLPNKWNTNTFGKPNVLHSFIGPNNDQTRKTQSSVFAYPMTEWRMHVPHPCILGSETMTINIYNDVG